MNGLARVVLVGNLTKDPELRATSGGTSVANLSVAVNERVKRQGEWGDYVSYFDCTVWAGAAENCAKWLSKGSPVAVDGRLTQRRWEHEGQKRSKVEVTADAVQFLPDGEKRERPPDDAPPASGDDDGSDIPF